jgi:hypothetical protein
MGAKSGLNFKAGCDKFASEVAFFCQLYLLEPLNSLLENFGSFLGRLQCLFHSLDEFSLE